MRKTKALTVDVSTEEQIGLWERALFSWLLSMLLRGHSSVLTLACLPMIDSKLDSRALHAQLLKRYCQSKTADR